jgi:hypothetical protein
LWKGSKSKPSMKSGPWGCNRPYFKAKLPFPRTVFGFCSS